MGREPDGGSAPLSAGTTSPRRLCARGPWPLTSRTETTVAWQRQARGVAAVGGKTATVSSLPECFEEGFAYRAGKWVRSGGGKGWRGRAARRRPGMEGKAGVRVWVQDKGEGTGLRKGPGPGNAQPSRPRCTIAGQQRRHVRGPVPHLGAHTPRPYSLP